MRQELWDEFEVAKWSKTLRAPHDHPGAVSLPDYVFSKIRDWAHLFPAAGRPAVSHEPGEQK